MTECYLTPDREDIPCRCDDCGEVTPAGELDMVNDIQERLSPGCLVPAGQCPHCGALAYYEDEHAPDWTNQSRANRASDLIAAAWSAFDDEEDSVKEEHEELIAKLQAFTEGR